jgi:hypothetical protein
MAMSRKPVQLPRAFITTIGHVSSPGASIGPPLG